MQIGVPVEELGIKFDYAKVTWVQEIMWPEDESLGKKIEALEVHFMGGESIVMPHWNLVKWGKLEQSILTQMLLSQPAPKFNNK